MLDGARLIGTGLQGFASHWTRVSPIRQDAADFVQGTVQDGQRAAATAAGESSGRPHPALAEPQQPVRFFRGAGRILPVYELAGGG